MPRRSPTPPAQPVQYMHQKPRHAVTMPPLTPRLREVSDECARRLFWALRPANRPPNFKLP